MADDWNRTHVEGSLLLHLVEGRNFDAALREKQGAASRGKQGGDLVFLKITRRGDTAMVTPKKAAARRVPYDCKVDITSPPVFDLLKGKLEVELVEAASGRTVAKANVGLPFLVHVAPGQAHTIDLLVVPDDPKAPPIKLPRESCPGVKFVIYPDFPSTSPTVSHVSYRPTSPGRRSTKSAKIDPLPPVMIAGDDVSIPTPDDPPLLPPALPSGAKSGGMHRPATLLPKSPVRSPLRDTSSHFDPREAPVECIDVTVVEGSGCAPLRNPQCPCHCKVQVTFHGKTQETPILAGPKPDWRGRAGRGAGQPATLRFKNTQGARLSGNYAHIRVYCAEDTHDTQGALVNRPWQVIGTVDVELGHIAQYRGRRLDDTWVALDADMNSRLIPKGGAAGDEGSVSATTATSSPRLAHKSPHRRQTSPAARPNDPPHNTIQTAVSDKSRGWLCIAVSLRSAGSDAFDLPMTPEHNSIIRARGAPPPPPLLKEIADNGGAPTSPAPGVERATEGARPQQAGFIRPHVYESEGLYLSLAKTSEGIWEERHPVTPRGAGGVRGGGGGGGGDLQSMDQDSLSRESSPGAVPGGGRGAAAELPAGARGAGGGGGGVAAAAAAASAAEYRPTNFAMMQSRGVSPPRMQPMWGVSTPADVLTNYLTSLDIGHAEVRKATVVLAKHGVKDLASLLLLTSDDMMHLPLTYAVKRKVAETLA